MTGESPRSPAGANAHAERPEARIEAVNTCQETAMPS